MFSNTAKRKIPGDAKTIWFDDIKAYKNFYTIRAVQYLLIFTTLGLGILLGVSAYLKDELMWIGVGITALVFGLSCLITLIKLGINILFGKMIFDDVILYEQGMSIGNEYFSWEEINDVELIVKKDTGFFSNITDWLPMTKRKDEKKDPDHEFTYKYKMEYSREGNEDFRYVSVFKDDNFGKRCRELLDKERDDKKKKEEEKKKEDNLLPEKINETITKEEKEQRELFLGEEDYGKSH
jgi:hypothetical protein